MAPRCRHPAISDGLDLVETSDQITHEISLDDPLDTKVRAVRAALHCAAQALHAVLAWQMGARPAACEGLGRGARGG